MEIIILIGAILGIILQVMIVIKFFQIASDVREFKRHLKESESPIKITKELLDNAEVEQYIGNHQKEKELLCKALYRLEKGMSPYYDKSGYLVTSTKIDSIKARLSELG